MEKHKTHICVLFLFPLNALHHLRTLPADVASQPWTFRAINQNKPVFFITHLVCSIVLLAIENEYSLRQWHLIHIAVLTPDNNWPWGASVWPLADEVTEAPRHLSESHTHTHTPISCSTRTQAHT